MLSFYILFHLIDGAKQLNHFGLKLVSSRSLHHVHIIPHILYYYVFLDFLLA